MYNILISGYYGFNNIGDESILRAVVDRLKDKLPDIDITVLSQSPETTAEKYGVKSVNRKSPKDILKAVSRCDLLISGGGSLLQDVTSKKSILYYLAIMWMAYFMRKKVFIYSQGIGPINGRRNRKMTRSALKRASGIVVRDDASKELLVEIGLKPESVVTTCDPVLGVHPAELSVGRDILLAEGVDLTPGRLKVGWAIKERKLDSSFVEQVCKSISALIEKYQAEIILIPFHFSEDMAVIEEIQRRLGSQVCCIRHKYLTNEMLSIIGNMDILVGVRLHSVIHAAIMDVPMIAVSYDPKINSFMNSIDMKAMCSIYDFKSEFFLEEFEKTLHNQEELRQRVRRRIKILLSKLDTNEKMIEDIREKKEQRQK